jgi:hypothetical protein
LSRAPRDTTLKASVNQSQGRIVLLKILVPLCALLATGGASATCYAVYSNNQLVYQSFERPVDMSRPLSETVPARFGRGASMVFSEDERLCTNRGDLRRPAGTEAQANDARYNRLAAMTGRPEARAQAQAAGAAISLENIFNGTRYTPSRRGTP